MNKMEVIIEMKLKRALNFVLASVLAITSISFAGIKSTTVNAEYSRVAVHDPSIVKLDDGSYFIIGSHLSAARSTDLENWTYTANSEAGTKNTTFFKNIYTDLAVPEKWSNTSDGYDLSGNLWAPDIMYNSYLKKWCMYLSVNGENYHSSIVLCTADNIEGPYKYVDTIVYSGFETKPANNANNYKNTDVEKVLGSNPDLSRYLSSNGRWNPDYGTNAIDPCVFTDQKGNLHMVYGSWFGGLYSLELDEKTGLRDYKVKYNTVSDASDAYMGTKLAGGHRSSGEGPYIKYMTGPNGKGYYYLFTSYGGFSNTGGYNMRIFRSEDPNGPYVDENGNSAIYKKYTGNTNGMVGERLMSNYQWNCNSRPNKSQGHNSVLVDDDGKIYVIYHNKFDDQYGFHEIRVHQMIINRDGWPTALPYEYSGETVSKTGYLKSDIVGQYEFIFHDPTQKFVSDKWANVEKSKTINLKDDGTVTGDVTGTWTVENNSPYMTFTYNNVVYKGAFAKMYDESNVKELKMTFTATGNNTCIWGSKNNSETAALTEGGFYMIKNVNSGMYLEVQNGLATNGQNVQQFTANGEGENKSGDWNTWRAISAGDGYYYLQSQVGDKTYVLDVEGKKSDNGTNIEIYSYRGTDNQKFSFSKNSDGSYKIRTKVSDGKSAVEVINADKNAGANVQEWEINGANCQDWVLEEITPYGSAMDTSQNYMFENQNSSLYMEVRNGNAADGENIQQFENNGSGENKSGDWNTWTLKQFENSNIYYIVSKLAGGNSYYLNIADNSSADGANVELHTNNKTSSHLVIFVKNPDGSYYMQTRASKYKSCVEVSAASKEAAANIGQWTINGNNCQHWILHTFKDAVVTTTTDKPTVTTTTTAKTETTTTIKTTNISTLASSATTSPITTTSVKTTESQPTTDIENIIWGDADLNNSVNISDAVLVSRYVAGSISLSDEGKLKSDVYRVEGDPENNIDSRDVETILKYLVQEITKRELPIIVSK